MAALIPWLAGGLLGGYAYNRYKKEDEKKKKSTSRQRKSEKKYLKALEKAQKKYVKDQESYNRQLFEGPWGERAYNERMRDFYNTYGDESFKQHRALTTPQHNLLRDLAKRGSKSLRNQIEPTDIRDIGKYGSFKRGEGTLEDLMRNPGISDIEKNKYYRQSGNTIRDLLENPGVTDIQEMQGYQRGQQGLNELLDQSPEAFARYAKPYKDYFQQEIVPELIGRFGGGGKNSSALNNALASAAGRMTSQIEQSRQGLIPEALRQQLQYAQAPLAGELGRADILGKASRQGLEFAAAPWEGQKAAADIRGRAAQGALPFSTDRAKIQALQAENQRNQNSFGLEQQRIALGINPYHSIYRQPQAPTGYLTTGGAQPVQPFAGLPPYPQRQVSQPWHDAVSAFAPAAFGAAGKAAGEPIGGTLGSGLANLFGNRQTGV